MKTNGQRNGSCEHSQPSNFFRHLCAGVLGESLDHSSFVVYLILRRIFDNGMITRFSEYMATATANIFLRGKFLGCKSCGKTANEGGLSSQNETDDGVGGRFALTNPQVKIYWILSCSCILVVLIELGISNFTLID